MSQDDWVNEFNRRFLVWFDDEVSNLLEHQLTPTEIKIICKIAWSNGFVVGSDLTKEIEEEK